MIFSTGTQYLPVSYPSLQPPVTTAFKCYARKKTKTDGGDEGKTASGDHTDEKDLLVVGESDKIEFISNEEQSQFAADAGCR
jgi:DNA-directed RNA polymerase I subunit RPA49